MDKPDVYMPLFIGDYLAGTSRLTTELHGAYLLLIMDYWMNGPPPDNDTILASITRMPPDAWSIARASLEHYFSIADGCWKHKRVEEELATATGKKQKAKEKAQRAAAARWGSESKPNQETTEDAPSNAPSTPQALHEECPSPSPLPIDSKESIKTLTSEAKASDSKCTPDDYRLAEWMAERVLKVAPKSKPPKLEAWADTVRLMRERDNHSHRDIAAVFSFANNDQFWSVNILSPAKLREKFGDLDAKMRRASNDKPNHSGGGAAAPKQTAAQRIAAKRQQLAAQSPDMGVVATDDGDVWPPLEQSAGRGTQRYLASGNS